MDRAADDVLGGVESLVVPSPPSAVSLSPCLSLPVSSSSSLLSSYQVTARLHSSLQHSPEREVKGHRAETHRSVTARQVSFSVTSPSVTDEMSESQEMEFGLGACSSSNLPVSGMEEAELESEPITEELELDSQSSTKLLGGRQHIEELENVRTHLQTIMQTRTTETHEQHLQDESDTSFHTSHLLSGVEEFFPRYSRLCADFDSAPFHTVSELQLIRETLERERARRKQCEQQLLTVQSTALGLQHQLALAVSADRKKDVMIEQLDKVHPPVCAVSPRGHAVSPRVCVCVCVCVCVRQTLEKVVEGWRHHEQEKSEGVRRLQEEKETAEKTQQKQKEALVCLEKSLSEAVATLDKEQKDNKNLQSINKKLECEMVQLRACVCELQQEVERLRLELEEKSTETEKLHTHRLELQQQLEQHTLQSKHTHTHLQQELSLLTQQLETEKEQVVQEVQLRQEALSRLQQLQHDLEETKRERDTARVNRALDQAGFDAQRSQWEVEVRLSVEQQVTQRLVAIQEENANANAKLREQHRKQLLDLSTRHECEFSNQRDQFSAQLKERDDRQHQLTLDYNNKMAELQKELVSMESSKKRLESQKEELVSRLQGMMRSHWAEALRLLTNNEDLSLSFQDTSKIQSSVQTFKSSDINITSQTLSTVAPRAVVLQMCRDRGRGIRGQADSGRDWGRVESDFSLLNHSHTFSPLEPVLDDTHLTGGGVGDGDLWDRPVDRGIDKQREKTGGEMNQSEMNLTLHSTHSTHDSFCEVNHSRVQSDQQDIRRLYTRPNCRLRPNQTHASNDVWTNQSSEKGGGSGEMSKHMHNNAAAPPTQNHDLSVKLRAPPPATANSSVCDERQNELHYYIAKLLERSPGEPLDEHQAQPIKTQSEKPSANSGVSSQVELKLEQLAVLPPLTLPSTHTTQQLANVRRSGEVCSDPVGANLDHRLTQSNRKERQSASRPTPHMATRGRYVGPQGQRVGCRVTAWR